MVFTKAICLSKSCLHTFKVEDNLLLLSTLQRKLLNRPLLQMVQLGMSEKPQIYNIPHIFASFGIFRIFEKNAHITYFSSYCGLLLQRILKRILKYYFLILLLNK